VEGAISLLAMHRDKFTFTLQSKLHVEAYTNVLDERQLLDIIPCSVRYLCRRFGGSGLLVQVNAEVIEGQLHGDVGGDLRNQRRNRGAYRPSLVGGVSVGKQLSHCTVLEILLGFNYVLFN
jgi:hypothetical protein